MDSQALRWNAFLAEWCSAEEVERLLGCSAAEFRALALAANLKVAQVWSDTLKRALPGYWVHMPTLRLRLKPESLERFASLHHLGAHQPAGFETIPIAMSTTGASKALIKQWIAEGKVDTEPRRPGSKAKNPQVMVRLKQVRMQLAIQHRGDQR